jgi:AcrR family transcriptional regulator
MIVGPSKFDVGGGYVRVIERTAGGTKQRGTGGPLRRAPVQERSAARVQRMLDACAELVEEVGYEGLTTTLLAERAGVAIGSVYQFFPDKRAVVQALTQRNLDLYQSRVAAKLAQGTFSHWWEIVDTAIDEYIELNRTAPGFRVLHFGDVVDRHLLDLSQDNDTVVARGLARILVEHGDAAPGLRLDHAMLIAVTIGDALIKLAFRQDSAGDQQVLTEAKTIIRGYLSEALGG